VIKKILALIILAGIYGYTGQAESYTSFNETDFALEIANTRNEGGLSGYINGQRAFGIYTGQDQNGCRVVALKKLDGFKRLIHYKVCGQDVSVFHNVPPLPPDRDRGYQAFLGDIARNAWRQQRRVSSKFEGFNLVALPIGPQGSDGCIVVRENVIFRNLLAYTAPKVVCRN